MGFVATWMWTFYLTQVDIIFTSISCWPLGFYCKRLEGDYYSYLISFQLWSNCNDHCFHARLHLFKKTSRNCNATCNAAYAQNQPKKKKKDFWAVCYLIFLFLFFMLAANGAEMFESFISSEWVKRVDMRIGRNHFSNMSIFLKNRLDSRIVRNLNEFDHNNYPRLDI